MIAYSLISKEKGHTADAVVFDDGTAVLHWRTDPPSTEMYPTEFAMRQVREASGNSYFVMDGD